MSPWKPSEKNRIEPNKYDICTVAPRYNEPRYNEPRYNEPRYNEDPVITNNIWKPGRTTVKYVETNPGITKPTITNWFWRS